MSKEPDGHMVKAERLLRQAHLFDANEAPESVVHLAYYAMFHAATAVLLKQGNSTAVTHSGLIGAFGQFAKDRGEAVRQQGRSLNRAEDLRLLADYGISYQDLAESAARLREDALAFVDYCASVVRS